MLARARRPSGRQFLRASRSSSSLTFGIRFVAYGNGVERKRLSNWERRRAGHEIVGRSDQNRYAIGDQLSQVQCLTLKNEVLAGDEPCREGGGPVEPVTAVIIPGDLRKVAIGLPDEKLSKICKVAARGGVEVNRKTTRTKDCGRYFRTICNRGSKGQSIRAKGEESSRFTGIGLVSISPSRWRPPWPASI